MAKKQTVESERSEESINVLRDSVSKFAQKEIAPIIEELDHYPFKPFPDALLKSVRELGLLSLTIPEEYDGSAEGMNSLSAVLEELAGKASGISAIVFVNSLAQAVVQSLGGKGVKDAWLKPSKSGIHPLLAIGAYSVPGEWSTDITATEEGSGFKLDGIEEFVPNSPVADGLILKARLRKSKKLGLFILSKDQKGIEISEPILTLGLRSCPVADVVLSSVKAGQASVVWTGEDSSELAKVFAKFYGPCASMAAGILGGSLTRAVSYAKERYQGGKNIADHSHIRMMLSGIISGYEEARLTARILSEKADSGSNGESLAGANMLAEVREQAIRGTTDGVQILGGYGYMEDYGQERRLRDARQVSSLLGRNDLLKLEGTQGWIERT